MRLGDLPSLVHSEPPLFNSYIICHSSFKSSPTSKIWFLSSYTQYISRQRQQNSSDNLHTLLFFSASLAIRSRGCSSKTVGTLWAQRPKWKWSRAPCWSVLLSMLCRRARISMLRQKMGRMVCYHSMCLPTVIYTCLTSYGIFPSVSFHKLNS